MKITKNTMKNSHIFQIIHKEFWSLVVLDQENTLLNLINEQNDIDKIYLYAGDLNEPKYKILIKKRKDAEIKHLDDPNAFIERSDTMDDVYEVIDNYNPKRKKMS